MSHAWFVTILPNKMAVGWYPSIGLNYVAAQLFMVQRPRYPHVSSIDIVFAESYSSPFGMVKLP
jgi:hypothetical protein